MTRPADSWGQGRKIVVFLLITVGPPLAAAVIQRYLSGPDAFRTLGMRGSLAVKRCADAQVTAWSKVSALAATHYQRARL